MPIKVLYSSSRRAQGGAQAQVLHSFHCMPTEPRWASPPSWCLLGLLRKSSRLPVKASDNTVFLEQKIQVVLKPTTGQVPGLVEDLQETFCIHPPTPGTNSPQPIITTFLKVYFAICSPCSMSPKSTLSAIVPFILFNESKVQCHFSLLYSSLMSHEYQFL